MFTNGSLSVIIINFQKKKNAEHSSGKCNLLCTIVHAVVTVTSCCVKFEHSDCFFFIGSSPHGPFLRKMLYC